MKVLTTICIILVVAVFLGFSGGIVYATPSAQALFEEDDFGFGIWFYVYTLYNTSDPIADAGYDIYDFFLNFAAPVTLFVPGSPLDWEVISDSSTFIDWFSLLPGEPPTGADIAPGTSLSWFMFFSDTRLGSLAFDVLFSNPTGGDPVPYSGTTAPVTAPIPEPATLILLGSGLAGFGYLRMRRVF